MLKYLGLIFFSLFSFLKAQGIGLEYAVFSC